MIQNSCIYAALCEDTCIDTAMIFASLRIQLRIYALMLLHLRINALILFEYINWASLWENRLFAYAKAKTQISCAVTAQQISAFVFAIRIVQSLFYLNPKFQASSHLLWLYSPICVGPGRKSRRPVFSQRGSICAKLQTGCGCMSASYARCHGLTLASGTFFRGKVFPSSADSRRACYQFLAKECVLSTG